jgi:O-acetylserine/cysteine efflux transporter
VPFGTILAVLFLGERIGWKRTTAIALAFAGLLVIGFDPVVFAHLDALAMVVGAAFAMALGQVWIARIASTNVFTMNAWIGVIGGPGLLALSLLLESGQAEAVRDAGWLDWSTIAYSAIAASIIGHGGSYFLMRHYPVNLVLAMFLLAPVFGVTFGVLLWGDQLTWKLVVGGACALIGVCVVTLRAGKRPRAPGSPPLTPQNRSA